MLKAISFDSDSTFRGLPGQPLHLRYPVSVAKIANQCAYVGKSVLIELNILQKEEITVSLGQRDLVALAFVGAIAFVAAIGA